MMKSLSRSFGRRRRITSEKAEMNGVVLSPPCQDCAVVPSRCYKDVVRHAHMCSGVINLSDEGDRRMVVVCSRSHLWQSTTVSDLSDDCGFRARVSMSRSRTALAIPVN